MITLGETSLARTNGLHPDLVRVINEAARTAPPELDFMILEGVRSPEQMCVNYGKGRTAAQCEAKKVPGKYAQPKEAKVTWLNDPFASMHRIQPGGGRAFDAVPYPVDWNDRKRFQKLAEHILGVAKRLKIGLRWGRDWDQDGRYEEKGETDGPHFELT